LDPCSEAAIKPDAAKMRKIEEEGKKEQLSLLNCSQCQFACWGQIQLANHVQRAHSIGQTSAIASGVSRLFLIIGMMIYTVTSIVGAGQFQLDPGSELGKKIVFGSGCGADLIIKNTRSVRYQYRVNKVPVIVCFNFKTKFF
jgi:hypothetical protein